MSFDNRQHCPRKVLDKKHDQVKSWSFMRHSISVGVNDTNLKSEDPKSQFQKSIINKSFKCKLQSMTSHLF